MSDLAVLDLEKGRFDLVGRPVTIVSSASKRSTGSDATLTAFLDGLSMNSVKVVGAASEKLVEKFGATFVSTPTRRHTLATMAESRAVVVLTPHFDDNVVHAGRMAKLALQARIHGQTVAFVAATCSRQKSRMARRLTRIAVENADLTVVRDEASADNLLDAGVSGPLRIGADPAWSHMGALFAARERQDRVVVALDDNASALDIDHLGGVLRPVADRGTSVVLQPWDASRQAGEALMRRLADDVGGDVSVIDPPTSLDEARELYSTSRAVLSLRSHALIAAACAGAPTLVIDDGHSGRVAGELGMDTIDPAASPAEVGRQLLETFDAGTTGNGNATHLIDRAKATVDLVRFLITEGRDQQPSANNPLPLYPTPWRS